jgi:hypothetical protein
MNPFRRAKQVYDNFLLNPWDPSLSLRMTVHCWVIEGKKWRFANYFFLFDIFQRIATSFPIPLETIKCHSEAQRGIPNPITVPSKKTCHRESLFYSPFNKTPVSFH